MYNDIFFNYILIMKQHSQVISTVVLSRLLKVWLHRLLPIGLDLQAYLDHPLRDLDKVRVTWRCIVRKPRITKLVVTCLEYYRRGLGPVPYRRFLRTKR